MWVDNLAIGLAALGNSLGGLQELRIQADVEDLRGHSEQGR